MVDEHDADLGQEGSPSPLIKDPIEHRERVWLRWVVGLALAMVVVAVVASLIYGGGHK